MRLEKELKARLLNGNPVAVCNAGEIMDIINDIDDYVVLKNSGKLHILKIYECLSSDNFYFNFCGIRIHLNECIRTM